MNFKEKCIKNIDCSPINESARFDFNLDQFGKYATYFEGILYQVAERLIKGYHGGYWNYHLINALPVYSLSSKEGICSVEHNFDKGLYFDLPSVLAGIYVTSQAVMQLLLLKDQGKIHPTNQKNIDIMEMALPLQFRGKSIDHDYLAKLHGDLISLGYDIAEQEGVSTKYFALVD